jgi:hypothetical protein
VAATPEYRAGAAASGHARAVVLEDRRSARVVFVEADFAIPRAVSDFVAVQLVKRDGLDRAGMVLSGTGSGAADAVEIVSAVEQALSRLEPATATFDGVLSVRSVDGRCLATLYPARLDGCRGGIPVRGPIRAVFQMLDVPHRLGAMASAYPVQAVAIGRQVTVLALGGDVAPGRFAAAGRMVVPFANDTEVMPEGFEARIEGVLKRVR